MGVQWGPGTLLKVKRKKYHKEESECNTTSASFWTLQISMFWGIKTKNRNSFKMKIFFQTSRNRTHQIRDEAHRPFISKRPLTVKMDLIPHFFQLQLQLHLDLALNFVNFEVKKLTPKNDGKLAIKHANRDRIRSYFRDLRFRFIDNRRQIPRKGGNRLPMDWPTKQEEKKQAQPRPFFCLI